MKMKRIALCAVLGVLCVSLATPAFAHRYSRRDDGHPLRFVAFVIHPIGVALEYAIARPVHRFVSQPDADIWFGHKVYVSDYDQFHEWVHGDYEPSIAETLGRHEAAAEGVAEDAE